MTAGDGDDKVDSAAAASTLLSGGPGDDVLVGGTNDTLGGGPDADACASDAGDQEAECEA